MAKRDERSSDADRMRGAQGERKVELREEELTASKRMVETGEVKIGKDVVSEQKTIDVPVSKEEVTIERRAVDRRPTGGSIGDGGDVIEVPLHEEQVQVDKQAVVYEELEVGKRAVQETDTVSDTVRREVADVQTEGDVDTRGDEPRRRR